jgi:hypothetical protein
VVRKQAQVLRDGPAVTSDSGLTCDDRDAQRRSRATAPRGSARAARPPTALRRREELQARELALEEALNVFANNLVFVRKA